MPAEKGSSLAKARIRAHAVFDELWLSGEMKRGAAYAWLAKEMKMSRAACHMGCMDEDQCERVVHLCVQRSFAKLECAE